jgi:hypothetical protein
VKASVFGFVHDSHAATAEFFEDAVVRNGLADHRPESYVDKTLVVNQSRHQICLVSNARKYFDKERKLTVQRSSYTMAVIINMAVGILC